MKSRLFLLALAVIGGALTLAGSPRTASAQAALDDDGGNASPTPTPSNDDDAQKTHIGFGLRFRDAIVPKSMIELFVAHAPGGSSELGTGFELSRRKGNFEVQFGFERDPIQIKDGFWVDKGDTIPADEPDHVYFNTAGKGYFSEFGWYTAEISFLAHTEITKWFSVRYGGGAGIGFFTDKVRRTDAMCSSSDINSCHDSTDPADTNVKTPYDIPPVMLVVNAIIGVQLRPVDHVFINIETGIRTIPFFGTTIGYYF